MVYLIIMAFVVAFFVMVPPEHSLRYNNSKKIMIICGALVTMVLGLRLPVGDTAQYVYHFWNLRSYKDFAEYTSRFEESNFFFSETGFFYCLWLLGKLTSDGQVLVFLSSAFITFSACRFIWKNSNDAPLALLIYVCLGMMTFNMNGMRQGMAVSVCLFAYEYAKKRKLLPFAILILVAMQFHKTAICFAPVYFFNALKNSKGNWLVYFGGLAVFLLFLDRFVLTFNSLTGKEYATQDAFNSGGVTVVLLYLGGIVLTLLRPSVLQDKAVTTAMLGTVTGLVIYLTRYFANQMMERVSYYYFYFLILLIPETLRALKTEEQRFIKVFFIFATVALLAYRLYVGTGRYFSLYFL